MGLDHIPVCIGTQGGTRPRRHGHNRTQIWAKPGTASAADLIRLSLQSGLTSAPFRRSRESPVALGNTFSLTTNEA